MEVRPFRRAAAITPHDTNVSITGSPTAIYVGGAGNMVVRLSGADATSVTFSGLLAGHVYYLEPTAVLATNTTASNLVALYE